MKPPIQLRDEKSLQYAIERLRELDADCIDAMLQRAGPAPLRLREPGLGGMIRIIISQQVSTASANAIHGRFCTRFDELDHAGLLALRDEELQACGLSLPKIRTVRHFCAALHDGSLDLDLLPTMSPDEARQSLTQVKGIGPWSADVYLLFCLGHTDVWPAGDLALQEGIRLALNLRKRPDPARLEKISKRWRPWRAAAARLVWAYYGAVRSQPAAGQPKKSPPRRATKASA